MNAKEEAYKRFPEVKKGTKGMIDSGKRRYFIEGANWQLDYDNEIINNLNKYINKLWIVLLICITFIIYLTLFK